MRLVHDYKIHPDYGGSRRVAGSPYYDVAVVTLDRPANLSDGSGFVEPICLPDKPSHELDKYEGDQVEVAGK